MIIILTLLSIFVALILISWVTHISMTKKYCEKYGYASYKEFKREFFNSEDLEPSDKNKYFWYSHSGSRIYESIIKFNYIGMVMITPIDWIIINIIFRLEYVRNNKTELHNWKSTNKRLD